MDNAIITLIVLAAVIALSYQQSRCLYSRLDYNPCKYPKNKKGTTDIIRARDNEYTIHHTKLVDGGSGSVECRVKRRNQIRTSITNLGTENMRIIYSPGYVFGMNYDDQLLVESRVRCKPGQLAFFNVTNLDLQGDEDCEDTSENKRCQDYILIDRGMFGTNEICGNQTAMDSVLELESGNFNVLFRTSEATTFSGFEMYVICFEPLERGLPGCFTPSDFNVSVCTGDGSGNASTDDERGRRNTYSNQEEDTLTYEQLFPGYPAGLRMNKDVAKFHSQWHKTRRQADELEQRFFERNILFNQTVNYTDNTVFVFDADNNTIIKYDNILMLQTVNASGNTTNYIGSAKNGKNPNFLGPGPLTVVERIAYLQLFVIDPRGLIPDPEEELDLIAMNRPLLDAVPLSDDFDNITDPDQTPAKLEFFDLFDTKKRDVAEETTHTVTSRQTEQQPAIELTMSSLFVTLRNLEACNPVLRSQARSTLQVFEMENAAFVRENRNFTITCVLDDSQLVCRYNTSDASPLPGRTTCMVNDQKQMPCEPFQEQPFDVSTLTSAAITKLVVRAINCNGQRVEVVVMKT